MIILCLIYWETSNLFFQSAWTVLYMNIAVPTLKYEGSNFSTPLPTLVISFPVFFFLLQPSREGNGKPLQYSCLENPMDGGAWWAAVHGVARSRTRLSDFPFAFHFHTLEKEMASHSSVLAWRIPGTGKPGGLPSLGSHRVGHDWSDLAVAAVSRNGILL